MTEGRQLRVAVGQATDRVPVVGPDELVGEVRAGLAGRSYDCADDLAVLRGSVLSGILPIERLFAAETRARVGDVMDVEPPVVTPDARRGSRRLGDGSARRVERGRG